MIRKLFTNPGRTMSGAIALCRGQWYRLKYRALGRRFRAGRNFRVYGKLDVRGPGEVVFGDNVAVIEHSRPWTYTRQARIVVGDNVLIGSTRFGCAQEIVVGEWCQLAESYIMDTDFHRVESDRRTSSLPPRVAPVRIGSNVWIAHYVGVLPGARIGDNSVVSFGSVCSREYPPNVILIGNPAKVAAPVPGAPAPATVTAGAPSVERSAPAHPTVLA